MDLSQLADLGELLGGVAVVASLVYLAAQIRQNTRTVRASTLHQNTDLWASLFLRLAEPDIAKAYAVGLTGERDIRPLHYTQFFFICRSMFLAFENQYYQMCHGVLDPEAYAGYERSISSQFLAFRGFRIWWDISRSVFSPEFVDHIDSMIADTPEADPGKLLREWQKIAQADPPPLTSSGPIAP